MGWSWFKWRVKQGKWKSETNIRYLQNSVRKWKKTSATFYFVLLPLVSYFLTNFTYSETTSILSRCFYVNFN